MKDYVQELERKDKEGKKLFIKTTLHSFGTPFNIQQFKAFPNKGENFIIDYPCVSPISKKGQILLTAHFDTFFGVPGANDNASGVAVLLGLAKKLCKEKPQVSQPVRIALFDLEERMPVGAGSRAYIKEFGIKDIDEIYNLEMVGMGDILLLWPTTEKEIKTGWLKSVAENAIKENLTIITMPSPRVNLITFPRKLGFASDHVPFVEKEHNKVVSFTTIPRVDLRYLHYVLEGKRTKRLVWDLVKHRFFGKGDIPKILRHYHSKNDLSDFVEENTLKKVLNILWKVVSENEFAAT